jgi:hypothetical protein
MLEWIWHRVILGKQRESVHFGIEGMSEIIEGIASDPKSKLRFNGDGEDGERDNIIDMMRSMVNDQAMYFKGAWGDRYIGRNDEKIYGSVFVENREGAERRFDFVYTSSGD